MRGVNKVTLVGTLGQDPEIHTFDNGNKIAKISIATSEKYKNKAGELVEDTEWHQAVFGGGLVDVVEKYLKKGSNVYVEGKIKKREYQDKENVKRYFTEIRCNFLTMLPSGAGTVNEHANTKVEELDDDLPF